MLFIGKTNTDYIKKSIHREWDDYPDKKRRIKIQSLIGAVLGSLILLFFFPVQVIAGLVTGIGLGILAISFNLA